MKKILGVLVLVLALGTVGCGKSTVKNTDNDTSNSKVEDKVKVKEEVDNSINKVSSLIDEKKYDEAKALIEQLNSKELEEAQKANINKLKGRIDSELAETEKEKEKNKEKKVSKKEEYRAKLDKIQLELKALDEKDASGKTLYMREAANERYKRWDAALNEIYGVLKGQLSASDMKKLQSEEIKWISNRDAKAKEESSSMKGGTMESVIYMNSMANTTENRCYELVEKYMQ
ncbi:lysozyme inhibitor LprI family protein [Clostridium sp. OS1-26]|uniref:lysozyme inhibitor LprI family protein n=1 Tax=Clostridium sp. OS1-26 TaxID=3070681 RepID=UPI0027E0594C|nr:lysozyme inhibitor LprI family protein [Clostridium sp. OS1-26]WML33640.1 lysozyme inhibitor LprI family protein [Clostridium sp. OS1-26]